MIYPIYKYCKGGSKLIIDINSIKLLLMLGQLHYIDIICSVNRLKSSAIALFLTRAISPLYPFGLPPKTTIHEANKNPKYH